MDICCCQFRTGVLLLGFMLGTLEVTFAVNFYTFKAEVQAFVDYQVPYELDLIAVLIIVGVDLIVNILMISGANKDYSGRRKDLRYDQLRTFNFKYCTTTYRTTGRFDYLAPKNCTEPYMGQLFPVAIKRMN